MAATAETVELSAEEMSAELKTAYERIADYEEALREADKSREESNKATKATEKELKAAQKKIVELEQQIQTLQSSTTPIKGTELKDGQIRVFWMVGGFSDFPADTYDVWKSKMAGRGARVLKIEKV